MISIIIPVYKSASTISRCIDSVLHQSYRNFELILVDDGSPDESAKICDYYATKDNRVMVIHQRNAGVSAARNKGLNHSHGELVTFIDSDDWIEEDYLQTLMNVWDANNCDLVACGITRDFPDRTEIFGVKNDYFLFTSTDADKFHALIQSRLLFGPCNKLFKNSILTCYDITFPESISYGEDRLFNYAYLRHSSSISTVSCCGYHYVMGNEQSLSSIKRGNQFELELSQWRELWKVYEQKSVMTETAKADLLEELYWMINDRIFASTGKPLSYRSIKEVLTIPECVEFSIISHRIKQNRFIKNSIMNRRPLMLYLLSRYLAK